MEHPNNSSIFLLDFTEHIPLYYQLIVKYFLPISIPAGIITSLLSVIVLPNSTVRINSRCRYLYLFYTVSELFLIFFKEMQDGFLSDGMYWLSGGKYFVSLETISGISCKVFRGFRFSFEVLAAYSITFMNIERFAILFIYLDCYFIIQTFDQ